MLGALRGLCAAPANRLMETAYASLVDHESRMKLARRYKLETVLGLYFQSAGRDFCAATAFCKLLILRSLFHPDSRRLHTRWFRKSTLSKAGPVPRSNSEMMSVSTTIKVGAFAALVRANCDTVSQEGPFEHSQDRRQMLQLATTTTLRFVAGLEVHHWR
jgi:hypothetical protein